MKIGEFFINLGFKGTDKAVKAAKEVKGTLGEIKTEGLAAKAAIIGAVYGLERLMANSSQTGAALVSFSNATGLSLESLQRWQYAAAQANVGAEEMKNSITHMQSAMINMAMGGGVPAGFGVISNAVGIDQKKIRDTEYMMHKLVEYAGKEKNVDFANAMLESMGFSLDMIAAARQGVFNSKNFKAAPVYSDNEALSLQKVNAAWGNLYKKAEMATGHFNAKHGQQLVKDLSMLIGPLTHLAEALVKIAETAEAFKLLTTIFEGWAMLFEAIGSGADSLNKLLGSGDGKKGGGGTKWTDYLNFKKGIQNDIDSYFKFKDPKGDIIPSKLAKDIKALPQAAGAKTNYNIVNHMHGVKDGQDAGHHMKKEVDRAGRSQKLKGRGT